MKLIIGEYSMEYEIGKVTFFDNHYGKIVSEEGEYLFLDSDIDTQTPLHVGDLVAFRGELKHDKRRAYFVKKAEEKLLENAKQKVLGTN